MARTPRRRVEATPGAGTPSGESAPRRVRENLPRPAAAPIASRATTGGTQAAPARRRSPLASLAKLQPSFIADIVSELRKVTWPTFSETRYLTTVVAIVAGVMGLFLGGLDLTFGWAIEKLFF